MVDGYNIRYSKQQEQTRAICHFIMTANNDNVKNPLPKMTDWWPLITDPKEDVTVEVNRMKELLQQANTIGSEKLKRMNNG